MKDIKITRNPFLLFAPFLLLYIVVIIVFRFEGMVGDESRYLIYSQYMINGFIPKSEINFDTLANGPGYSILLLPLVALHVSILWITLMNALFYYFSIILLYKVLIQFGSFRMAIFTCLFWACYLNIYENLIYALPETLTIFLVCLLIFCLVNVFKNINPRKINWYIFLSGFTFGFLSLTKPIFGYVFLFMIILIGILWIANTKFTNYKRAFIILLVALAITSPYLIYTYKATNKIFYWSTIGGNNLYWMTTPNQSEYGDWFPDINTDSATVTKNPEYDYFEKHIKLNHSKDFEQINKYKTGTKRDEAYKIIAINNIKAYPIKFIKNCVSNMGRILFNFPYSYRQQHPETLLRLPFNGVIVILSLFCIIPTFKNWRKINFAVRFLLLIAFLYLGGSLLGSAETRMFTMIVPILLIWIAVILQKSIRINFSWPYELH
ncbi:MAG: hypothetical protein ABI172_08175 [Ginsengibacter sp.]